MRKQKRYAELLGSRIRDLTHREIRRAARQYAKLATLKRRLNAALKTKVTGEK